MKIAVATLGKDENSDISERAGRSPYYLIFDENGKVIETIKNPFAMGGGGAGFGVAKMLADKGVDTIVAGRFGENMIEAIKSRGLEYIEAKGRIKEALMKIIKK